METLYIKNSDLSHQLIGAGSEGRVYSYQDKYAIKIFPPALWDSPYKLKRKMDKIEEMTSLSDPSFAFPLGIVSLSNEDRDGYYMHLIETEHTGFQQRSFLHLMKEQDEEKIKKILVKADYALQRLHLMGCAVGDLRGSNILIDKQDNPIYVDTDNYIYRYYTYDLIPDRAGCFYSMFGGRVTAYADNDKLLFALMALQLLTKEEDIFYFTQLGEVVKENVKELRMDKEAREVLDCIFSDAENKPYIGNVIPKIYQK